MTPAQTKSIDRMRLKIRSLIRFKYLATARLRIITQLTAELEATRQLNSALGRLAFRPIEKQDLDVIREIQSATKLIAKQSRAA